MQMSDHGLALLIQWEGFKTKLYDDGFGVATIGVSHIPNASEKSSGMLNIDGTWVPFANGISADHVWKLLKIDLRPYESFLDDAVTVDLMQNQFDALLSFCFQIGMDAFEKSSLLKNVNAGELDVVADDFRKWNKAGGVLSSGLSQRRENEIRLWFGQI